MSPNEAKARKSPARAYPMPDVKLLFGLSAGRCNEPTCFVEVLLPATEFDKAAVVGKIAHIEAHADEGPRPNPNLTLAERDCYSNWILLCGLHHDTVDVQDSTYTVEMLQEWKKKHESNVRHALSTVMPGITYAELEVVTKAVAVVSNNVSNIDFHITPPVEKMSKNGLTANVHGFLLLALGKAPEVKTFVQHVAKIDANFPERLRSGFQREYDRLRAAGFSGDALFEEIVWFAAGGRVTDLRRMAAGLAVAGYYFMVCEVFEK